MSIEEVILERVRALPPAKKAEVLEFVSGLATADRLPFHSPKGILSDLNFTLTEEDLAEGTRKIPREAVPDLPDRVIAATAPALGTPLVTRDRKIQASGESRTSGGAA